MPGGFLEFVKGLEERENVRGLGIADLQREARTFGRVTVNESLGFFSNVRNRSAAVSLVVGGEEVQQPKMSERQAAIMSRLDQTLEAVKSYLACAPLICVKKTISDNTEFNPKCTLFLSTQRPDNVRQAYIWANTLRDYHAAAPGPGLYLVCLPEWPEADRQVLVFPEEGLTVVLGSDYVGEVKMGFLRMAMWEAKQQDMLSLHAGSKIVSARQGDGRLQKYGMLFFGLSGTGKTTHSCHDHGLVGEGEGIEILQDDIVSFRADGSALGTERGFYLKTEGVRAESQPVIFEALSRPEALFENVMIDSSGKVDFTDLTLGGNGRAVISRESMRPHTADRIDLPPLDQLDGLIMAFITRRMTVMPLVSRLNPAQAAAAFMLGESVETSAGDPRRAGESVRVVGTNPFLIGNEAEEGNWIYDFLKRNQGTVQCYLVNTGGVGEVRERDEHDQMVLKQPALRVSIEEMASMIRGIVRNTIEWGRDPYFGVEAPRKVDGLNLDKFDLHNFYSQDQIDGYASRLRQERVEWLARFPGLHTDIVGAL